MKVTGLGIDLMFGRFRKYTLYRIERLAFRNG